LQGRVDGIIGVFFHVKAKDFRAVIDQQTYVVRLESKPKKTGSIPQDKIYIDNIAASRMAVEYLLEQGHASVGMLTSHEGPARFREIGYHEALKAYHIKDTNDLMSVGAYSEDGGYQAMSNLLNNGKHPSAVFAANDLMAMGAMLAIREAGFSIPDDIAIMGFDDIPSARLVYPAPTTVAQFQHKLGQRAAEMLMERLDGAVPESGRSEAMTYELVVRNSA
jgi:LacI family transcriptional regulator